MVHVHLPDHTIKELNRMQGGPVKDKVTGHHDYERLGKLFNHPHLQGVLKENLQKHAEGGRVHLEELAKEGRKGDSKLALIPKSLMEHLDEGCGKHSINPHTGFPEYFGGREFIGELGKAGAGALDSVIPGLGSGIHSLFGGNKEERKSNDPMDTQYGWGHTNATKHANAVRKGKEMYFKTLPKVDRDSEYNQWKQNKEKTKLQQPPSGLPNMVKQ